jgi:hypothetical protein
LAKKLADDGGGVYGPVIRDLGVTSQGLELQLLGILVLLHIQWMHSLPSSLSPCAIMSIFDEPLTRCSHLPWLKEVLPDTAQQLQVWENVIATSPLLIPDIGSIQYLIFSQLVIEHLRMQVCYVMVLMDGLLS